MIGLKFFKDLKNKQMNFLFERNSILLNKITINIQSK